MNAHLESVPVEAALADGPLWDLHLGEGPLIGLAVHSGHELRAELKPRLAIDAATRLREEDPYADYWAEVCGSRLLPRRSRFEVDLNRRRAEAVYLQPADAWGLKVWRAPPSRVMLARALAEYDAFYAELARLARDLRVRYGAFVVLDLHSYNHRRTGPRSRPAEPRDNPEINIGTGSMDRRRWAPLVDRFMRDLAAFDFLGRHLDVRENVNFRGRHVAEFIHRRFPGSGCVLAVEVKKFFMDEWTGAADIAKVKALRAAFRATVPGLAEEVARP